MRPSIQEHHKEAATRWGIVSPCTPAIVIAAVFIMLTFGFYLVPLLRVVFGTS